MQTQDESMLIEGSGRTLTPKEQRFVSEMRALDRSFGIYGNWQKERTAIIDAGNFRMPLPVLYSEDTRKEITGADTGNEITKAGSEINVPEEDTGNEITGAGSEINVLDGRTENTIMLGRSFLYI